jgi:chemotaxis response regulator CheB
VTTHSDTDTRDDSRAAGSFPIVGIGASAGGLEAFSALLEHLPLDAGMGFVLVQHLDPVHDSALTQLLGRATPLPVHEVTNNLRVEPNHVYVIPPNTNLSITEGVLTLSPRPKTRTPNRSIDFFFEALANDQRDRAIGVILSGTATDGTVGLEAIKAEFSGHETFAAHDGLAAVEAAARLDPDVILLDIGLPILNGYEAARRIREQRGQQRRPLLIALTGWGQDEDRRRSEEAGFDAHLVKPVDDAVLGRLLAELGAGKQEVRD